jgi:hypothetical protein
MHEGARAFPATEQRTKNVVTNSEVADDEYVTQNCTWHFSSREQRPLVRLINRNMKTKPHILLVTIVITLVAFYSRAQGTFTFVTSVGSGSLTLNPVLLVPTGDNGSAAGYNSTLDSLIFNGVTYTNLDFSVYNNSFIVGGRDGFQILVDKSPFSSAARLEIDVAGDPGVVSGISVTDLMTVLNGFTALQAGSFSTTVLYNNPNPPFDQQFGSVSSFQAVPEPSAIALLGIGMPLLLAFRRHKE